MNRVHSFSKRLCVAAACLTVVMALPGVLGAAGPPQSLSGPAVTVATGTAATSLLALPQALWIGTESDGVLRLERGAVTRWASGDRGLPGGRVRQLLGHEGGVVALFEPATVVRLAGDRWEPLPGLSGPAWRLASAGKRLQAATDGGVMVHDGSGWAPHPGLGEGLREVALNAPRGQVITLDAGRELRIEERGTVRAREVPHLRGRELLSFLVYADRVLVGTTAGLGEYRTDGEMASTIDLGLPPIPPSGVSALGTAGPTRLLLGTREHGVWMRGPGGWEWLEVAGPVACLAGTKDYVAAGGAGGVRLWPLSGPGSLPTEAGPPVGAEIVEPELPLPMSPGVFAPERLGLVLTAPLHFPRYHLKSPSSGAMLSTLAERGALLFRSSMIYGGGMKALGMSCEYCHPGGSTSSKLFLPGLSGQAGTVDLSHRFWNPDSENFSAGPADNQSLRGIRFTAPYGHEGKIASLREFIRHVIVVGFDGPEPSPQDLDALVAYCNEFEFLPNPNLDNFGRLTPMASDQARLGEESFARPRPQLAGMSCASCHPPAAQFTDRKQHDVKSGGIFDTPTLLGVVNTEPYYHDGRYLTVRQVLESYDRRFELKLSREEFEELLAYLEAIGFEVDPFGEATGSGY
jgi:hypothetical protein